MYPTFVGIVNPHYQGEEQMVYLSDGAPLNISELSLASNGYEVIQPKGTTFLINIDGNLEGTTDVYRTSGYFCQLDCSKEGMNDHWS